MSKTPASPRILLLNTQRGWRGGERQTLYTAQGLVSQGRNVTVLCRSGQPLEQRARESGVPTLPVRSQGHALLTMAKRGRDFGVLHAQTAKAQSLAVLSRPFHRRPLVYTRRVDFRQSGPAARLKYARTDAVVAISQAIADYIYADMGVRAAAVIPSAVRPEPQQLSAEQVRTRYAAGQRRLIGTVAALVDHKDPLTMVRAVAELKRMRGDGFVFLHCGEGPLRPAVEAEIAALGLRNTYLLPGFCRACADHVRAMELFAMSSVEEGLGSTVLDAFLYGVPAVVTGAGGLPELGADGRAKVVPKADPAALAAAMQELLENPAAREAQVNTAQAYVQAEHSVDEMCRRYVRVYESLV